MREKTEEMVSPGTDAQHQERLAGTHIPLTLDLSVARYQWVLDALGERGARTWHVARKIGTTTATARRRLRVLEVAGKVRRNDRYSADNDIYWERALP